MSGDPDVAKAVTEILTQYAESLGKSPAELTAGELEELARMIREVCDA